MSLFQRNLVVVLIVVLGSCENRFSNDLAKDSTVDSITISKILNDAREKFRNNAFGEVDSLLDTVSSLAGKSQAFDLTWVHYQQGVNSIQLGGFDKALEQFKRSLFLLESKRDTSDIFKIYHRIGEVYSQLENYDKALEYFEKVKRNRMLSHYDSVLLALDVGLAYIGKNDLNDVNLPKIDLATRKSEDSVLQTRYYYVNGKLELAKGKKREAKTFLKMASGFARHTNNHRAYVESELLVSKSALDDGGGNDTDSTLLRLESTSNHFGFKDLLLETYEQLSEVYLARRDYVRATSYQDKFMVLRDKLYGEELLHKISALQVDFEERHQVRKIQEQNELMALQEETLQQERMVNIIIGLICFMLLVILVMLVRSYRGKRRMNAELDRLVQERTADLEREHTEAFETNKKLAQHIKETASQFRAPLATLKGICHVGKMDPNSQDSIEQFDIIERTADEITKIIDPLTKIDIDTITDNLERGKRIDDA